MTRSSKPSSSPSSRTRGKRFAVFEFTKEDELVIKKSSERFLGKVSNATTSPITKYTFLQSFAKGATALSNHSDGPIDVDAEGSQSLDCALSPVGVSLEDDSIKEDIFEVDSVSNSCPSDYEDDKVRLISDDSDRSGMSSLSIPEFCPATNEVAVGESASKSAFGRYEFNDVNMTVTVFPDFVKYGDIYSTESKLTFSCCGIKLEGSTLNGMRRSFIFEWAVSDVINIKSEWCRRVSTATIVIHLKSENLRGARTANKLADTELFQFSIHDPCWSKGEEIIKSLDVRYEDTWNVNFDAKKEMDEVAVTGQSNALFSKLSFSDSSDAFEGIVYPKDNPDPITISKREVELLHPDTFINDTIIDFYIKYLEKKVNPEEKKRFHFFNSFFFRKLADLDKDPSNACEGRAAFERVRKWTRKVDLFAKDYIFIPVNYSLHWSLIVICHPGEVANFRDQEAESSPKVPCILHMDSIRGSHRGLMNLFQSYLSEEWKERHRMIDKDIYSRFINMRFVSLKLPQQENSSDCGLFLLHYVELFLKEAPVEFSPSKISKFSPFLTTNWFPPMDASLKRAHIQKLIIGILNDHYQKASPATRIHSYPSSPITNKQENEVEFVKENASSTKFSCSDTEQWFETSELVTSPPRGLHGQCFRDSGPVGRHQILMSPIEEGEENGEQSADSSSKTEELVYCIVEDSEEENDEHECIEVQRENATSQKSSLKEKGFSVSHKGSPSKCVRKQDGKKWPGLMLRGWKRSLTRG